MNTTYRAHIKQTQRNVGIDVGKDLLDIHIEECDLHWQTENTAHGIKQLLSKLNRFKLTRVLVEATGGYERQLVELATEKGLPLIIVQPYQVRQFLQLVERYNLELGDEQ
jgi:transposase